MDITSANMDITSAQYLQSDGANHSVRITVNGVESDVPMDTNNTDYQAILDWVADGNTIADAD